MPEPDAFQANLQRGSILLGQNRYREALPYFQAAIAANPDSPVGYAELARCWNEIPAERHKAIKAIDRAISLAPTSSYYYGFKSWILVCQMRNGAAIQAASKGIALDPNCLLSLNGLANAYTRRQQWKKAEAYCLRILELSPNDNAALNLLAQALRRMGRWKECRAVVTQILAAEPEDAFGQTNAGYGALSVGDHLRANDHFLQALRMNPQFDTARRGLLASLRARIWVIRFNSRVACLMSGVLSRPATFLNLSLFVLGFIGFVCVLAGVGQLLNNIYPNGGVLVLGCVFGVFLLYLYLSALVFLMGNFLLLFDPLGRHALSLEEKLKASLPAFVFGLAIVLLCMNQGWALALVLLFSFGLLAFTIQYPLIKDRRQRRREAQAEN
jgi:tetratricopeptide (TPR) repeat protein